MTTVVYDPTPDLDLPTDADVAACLPAALRSTLDGLALHAPEIDVVPLALRLFLGTFPPETTTDQVARALLARVETPCT